ncbi:Protein of unknown function [Gryllus bimaculatus]|nr:Protein of unknown function [Gryllus bimaculatus]
MEKADRSINTLPNSNAACQQQIAINRQEKISRILTKVQVGSWQATYVANHFFAGVMRIFFESR